MIPIEKLTMDTNDLSFVILLLFYIFMIYVYFNVSVKLFFYLNAANQIAVTGFCIQYFVLF